MRSPDWVEDPDSRVNIVATAAGDLRGVGRLLLRAPLARLQLIARSGARRRVLQPAARTD